MQTLFCMYRYMLQLLMLFAGHKIPKRGEKIQQATGVVEALKQLDVRMITLIDLFVVGHFLHQQAYIFGK